jgi:hypothetical protein
MFRITVSSFHSRQHTHKDSLYYTVYLTVTTDTGNFHRNYTDTGIRSPELTRIILTRVIPVALHRLHNSYNWHRKNFHRNYTDTGIRSPEFTGIILTRTILTRNTLTEFILKQELYQHRNYVDTGIILAPGLHLPVYTYQAYTHRNYTHRNYPHRDHIHRNYYTQHFQVYVRELLLAHELQNVIDFRFFFKYRPRFHFSQEEHVIKKAFRQ